MKSLSIKQQLDQAYFVLRIMKVSVIIIISWKKAPLRLTTRTKKLTLIIVFFILHSIFFE